MLRMRRELRAFDLVACISSMKWKTMAPVENDKGERRGQGSRSPRTARRAAGRVTMGL